MTENSLISLYTQAFYSEHQQAIDASSGCGNVVELVEISNYVYMSVKATDYPNDLAGEPIDFREVATVDPDSNELDEAGIQSDLDELRAGVFDAYRMVVRDYLQVQDMQLAAGDWYDPYVFERWWDASLAKQRWRLILTRETTDALSIQVMNDNGSYWYTPGAFLHQGGSTWLINSWDGTASTEGQQVNYQFIFGSSPISQILQIPGDVDTLESYIAYGDTTPGPASSILDMDNDGKEDTLVYDTGRQIMTMDEDSYNYDDDADGDMDRQYPR